MSKHIKPYAIQLLQQLRGEIEAAGDGAQASVDIAEVIAIKPKLILQPLDGEQTYDDDDLLWNINPKGLKKNDLVTVGRDPSGHIIVFGRPDELSPNPTEHPAGAKMRKQLTKIRKETASWKAPKYAVDDLPRADNANGDVRLVTSLWELYVWKDAKESWEALTTAGGSGGASTFNDLTDVTITAPSTGQFPRYNGSQWVNTSIAQSDVTSLVSDLALKAPLASPALTGTPTAPTVAITSNNTSIATTAAVTTALASYSPTSHTHAFSVITGTIGAGQYGTGTIVDADISGSAAIALSKLAVDPLARANHTGTQLAATISDFSTAADARITLQKGVASGLATLDGGGKVPASQLPSALMEYQGNWNASTNSPTLADGTVANAGNVYRVSASGTQNLGSGSITFDVGDYVVCNAVGTWEKSDTTDAVASFNGRVGAVVPVSADYTVGMVTGAAPLASPTFTGTVTVAGVTGGAGAVNLTSSTTVTVPTVAIGVGSNAATIGAVNTALGSYATSSTVLSMIEDATEDLADIYHNHDSRYLKLTGGTVAGGTYFQASLSTFYPFFVTYEGAAADPFAIRADGQVWWGSGGAGRDTSLGRVGVGLLAMGAGHKLQQNAAPTVGDDLVNKTYADGLLTGVATTAAVLSLIEDATEDLSDIYHNHDSRYLSLSGGTSTGTLVVNSGSQKASLTVLGTIAYNVSSDAFGAAYYLNSGIQYGAGGGSAPDWTMARTGANEVTIGSGDVLRMDTVAITDNSTKLATTAAVTTALGSYLTAATAASTYVELAGDTMSGTLSISNGSGTNALLSYQQNLYTPGSSQASMTLTTSALYFGPGGSTSVDWGMSRTGANEVSLAAGDVLRMDTVAVSDNSTKLATTAAVTTALASYQPLDSDLTTIAGLTATTDNFMQAKAGAWASRTVAQVVTDLSAGGLLTSATAASTYLPLAGGVLTGDLTRGTGVNTVELTTASVTVRNTAASNRTYLTTSSFGFGDGSSGVFWQLVFSPTGYAELLSNTKIRDTSDPVHLDDLARRSFVERLVEDATEDLADIYHNHDNKYLKPATAATTYLPLTGGFLTGDLTIGATGVGTNVLKLEGATSGSDIGAILQSWTDSYPSASYLGADLYSGVLTFYNSIGSIVSSISNAGADFELLAFVSAPTVAISSNDTNVATTAAVKTYVDAAVGGFTVTAVKTTTYTAVAGDLVRCDTTSGAFTVTLPATHSAGVQVAIKDTSGTAGTSGKYLTVDTSDADTIDGNDTYVITSARGSATFVSDGTNWMVL